MSPLPNVLDSYVTASRQRDGRPPSPMSCVVKVADFSSRSYWDSRFASESSFEWLQPSSTILPTIQSELETQHRDGMAVLHLGSGSSDLSNRLRDLVSSIHRKDSSRHTSRGAVILNVDFAAAAIEIGRRRERAEFGDDTTHNNSPMRWAVADILDWTSLKRACDEHCGKGKLFSLIVEKSCTDAIACGVDVQLGALFSNDDGVEGPELRVSVPRDLYSRLFAPEAAVAIHLAAVAQPGGAWIALSYSGERFDFLRDARHPAAAMWSVERVQRIVTGSGVEAGHGGTVVHRPEIVHFVYTIRRKPGLKEGSS